MADPGLIQGRGLVRIGGLEDIWNHDISVSKTWGLLEPGANDIMEAYYQYFNIMFVFFRSEYKKR